MFRNWIDHQGGGKSGSRCTVAAQQIVVCQSPRAEEKLQPAIGNPGHRPVLYFSSAQEFARWLFGQHGDGGMLDTIVVTGLREAKPCAAAVLAIRSGHAEHLRPDAKRPQLTVRDGSKGGMDAIGSIRTNVDIGMVVVVPSGESTRTLKRQRANAAQWATCEDTNGWSLDVVVTKGIAQLDLILEAGMQESSEAGLAADHDTSPTDESVAAPPDGWMGGAYGSWHRLRTPSPVCFYKPRSMSAGCPPSAAWLLQSSTSVARMQESSAAGLAADHDTSPTDESVAAPPDGWMGGAYGSWHRLRTPSPDHVYKLWSWPTHYHSTSPTDQSVAAPPDGWMGRASGSRHRLRTPSPEYLRKPRCAA